MIVRPVSIPASLIVPATEELAVYVLEEDAMTHESAIIAKGKDVSGVVKIMIP